MFEHQETKFLEFEVQVFSVKKLEPRNLVSQKNHQEETKFLEFEVQVFSVKKLEPRNLVSQKN
jgi:hypothetical protein